MTPAAAITMLDRQIATHGQRVTLSRLKPNRSTVIRAWVRGYRADELQSGLEQGDRQLVISPTDLAGTPWANIDDLPDVLDSALIDGRTHTIIHAPELVQIAGTVVRINAWVRG